MGDGARALIVGGIIAAAAALGAWALSRASSASRASLSLNGSYGPISVTVGQTVTQKVTGPPGHSFGTFMVRLPIGSTSVPSSPGTLLPLDQGTLDETGNSEFQLPILGISPFLGNGPITVGVVVQLDHTNGPLSNWVVMTVSPSIHP